MSIGILLMVQVILIGLNAIFASAELAILSINETKLERMAEQGDKRARRLYDLTREPAGFLSTIQIAITLSGFLGSAFAADGFSGPLVAWLVGLGVRIPAQTLDTMAVVVITLILSYFTLVFGELVPKRIAMKKSQSLALAISGLISTIAFCFRPIVWLLSLSTNGVLRLCGIDPNEAEERIGEEEIRMMVEAGGQKGTIQEEEREFIQNVFEFDDLTIRDIATHRTEVVSLWLEDDEAEWERTICNSRYNWYPIYDGSPDQVVGLLNARDYFHLEDRSRQRVMEAAVREAFFVPETIKAHVLFQRMRNGGHSLAVVLDEYGGMAGVVTLHDLLEELVGDLGDSDPETQESEPHLVQVDPLTWQIHGNVDLREIAEITGHDHEAEEYDTITGWVFDALGRVPADGEQDTLVELQELTIRVLRVQGHQITEAELRFKAEEPEMNEM